MKSEIGYNFNHPLAEARLNESGRASRDNKLGICRQHRRLEASDLQ